MKNTAHQLLKDHGLTDAEAWGAALQARFAKEAPEEYARAEKRICRQGGDPIKKMTAHAQRWLKRLNER